MIGTDSSLFDVPVHDLRKLTVSSGERFEVLILFDGDDGNGQTYNPISSDANYIYLFSGSGVVKNTIPLAPKTQTTHNNLGLFPSALTKIKGV